MPNIPSNATLDELLAWMEQHSDLWNSVPPADLGITAAQVTAFKNTTLAARTAFSAASSARLQSKQATVAQTEAFRTMRRQGGDLVNIIKAFIEQSGNTSLWATAGLEPPAPSGEAPAPTSPFELGATLDSEGNLTIKWKARQPRGVSGVVYSVRRAFNGTGNFEQIDTVGEKTFTDTTVPQGTVSVSYVVVAKRGGLSSAPSPVLSVRFGHAVNGSVNISTFQEPNSSKSGSEGRLAA